MRLKIKLPTVNQKFEWFEIKKVAPSKIAKLLNKGANKKGVDLKLILPKAPLIKKEILSNGYEIYKLIIPFEISIDTAKIIDRLQKEIDRLERKTDKIADNIHTTISKTHKEKLQNRLKHLYQEQKGRQRKLKQIRKEILEIFTNWVIEYAESYGIKVIAIEKLGFKSMPKWKRSKAIKRFTEWFYSKIRGKIEYKAKIRGISVILVNSAYTSQYCHKCGDKGKADGLTLKCECGKYDRDYNASVNIGKRAIRLIKKIKTGKSKSREQGSRDIPAIKM